LAELGQQPAHPLAILRRRLPILRPFVGHLHVQAAGGADEPGLLLLQVQRLGFLLGGEQHVAPGKADEIQLLLGEQALQLSGFLSEPGQDVGAELDAVEAGLGDVGHPRHVVVPPRHGVAGEAEGACSRRRSRGRSARAGRDQRRGARRPGGGARGAGAERRQEVTAGGHDHPGLRPRRYHRCVITI
jgi:hypothetical protein